MEPTATSFPSRPGTVIQTPRSVAFLPVLGRGRHLGWCCQVCWGAQRCCSYIYSTAWSPFRQGCWTASSCPSQSCLKQSVNVNQCNKITASGLNQIEARLYLDPLLDLPHTPCNQHSSVSHTYLLCLLYWSVWWSHCPYCYLRRAWAPSGTPPPYSASQTYPVPPPGK